MDKQLFTTALKYLKNSYSPYSQFKVASAIKLDNGKIYAGCNIENASYGATLCAERVAIFKAMSEEGACKIKEVVVITNSSKIWPPCGLCLQVFAEFSEDNTVFYLSNETGENFEQFTFNQLLPQHFSPDFLRS
jgi:cytidine deaminase